VKSWAQAAATADVLVVAWAASGCGCIPSRGFRSLPCQPGEPWCVLRGRGGEARRHARPGRCSCQCGRCRVRRRGCQGGQQHPRGGKCARRSLQGPGFPHTGMPMRRESQMETGPLRRPTLQYATTRGAVPPERTSASDSRVFSASRSPGMDLRGEVRELWPREPRIRIRNNSTCAGRHRQPGVEGVDGGQFQMAGIAQRPSVTGQAGRDLAHQPCGWSLSSTAVRCTDVGMEDTATCRRGGAGACRERGHAGALASQTGAGTHLLLRPHIHQQQRQVHCGLTRHKVHDIRAVELRQTDRHSSFSFIPL
jgi:hypothetical protein